MPECWALAEHWAIAEELLALHEDWSGAVCPKKNPDPAARQ
ncbi:MAG: hypothetical protein M0Z46_03755 [Actinomycetota bacterium]|nr:hypothetical protein [Actinomycetota bacterium]MDA8309720.1 hypothetical protein [Actinomycetota bacterium]MDA8313839.1 hypothetical protein [Actinomycetota bacterium]